MKKITDWMGNEIKEGDEICRIRVIVKHNRVGFLIPNENKKGFVEYLEPERPDEDCFIKTKYGTVIRQEETMNQLGICEVTEDCTGFETLETMIAFSDIGNTEILAIKGVSDNEQLYRKSKIKS